MRAAASFSPVIFGIVISVITRSKLFGCAQNISNTSTLLIKAVTVYPKRVRIRLILPPKIGNKVKILYRINLHSSEPEFKSQYSRFIILIGIVRNRSKYQ